MDTQRQNFWKESIDKEAAVRLAWHMEFSKEFDSQANPIKKKTQNFLPKISGSKKNHLMNSTTQDYRKSKSKGDAMSMKNKFKDQGGETTLLLEMRPVTPRTKNLLYKGFSALGEGRYAYLQERKKKKPEQKYEFPITNGWEYGWKINDAMKHSTSKAAEFGRTKIVKDSFYRDNGVAPHNGDFLSCFQ